MSKFRTEQNITISDNYEAIDAFLKTQIEPLFKLEKSRDHDERVSKVMVDSCVKRILNLSKFDEGSRQALWDRVLRSFKISAPNIQCLFFSTLLSTEFFSELTVAQKSDFVVKLTDFYGKGKTTNYYPYNTVLSDPFMAAELNKLNQAVLDFSRKLKTELSATVGDEYSTEAQHVDFLLKKIPELTGVDEEKTSAPPPVVVSKTNVKSENAPASPTTPLLQRNSGSRNSASEKMEGQVILTTVPSKAAITWGVIWRFLLIPLTFGEGLARGFDKYAAAPAWQRWGEETGLSLGKGFAFVLQGFKNLASLVFAPEKLITQYPEWKWAIRVANIAAWIGLGIACPPLFAKLGLSLPFVALSTLGPLSASQVFWMAACPAAYAARQGLEYVGRSCFDWGGKEILSMDIPRGSQSRIDLRETLDDKNIDETIIKKPVIPNIPSSADTTSLQGRVFNPVPAAPKTTSSMTHFAAPGGPPQTPTENTTNLSTSIRPRSYTH